MPVFLLKCFGVRARAVVYGGFWHLLGRSGLSGLSFICIKMLQGECRKKTVQTLSAYLTLAKYSAGRILKVAFFCEIQVYRSVAWKY